MLADDDRYTSATLAEGARVSPAVIAAEWPRRRRSSRSWAAKWRKYGSAGPIAGGGLGFPRGPVRLWMLRFAQLRTSVFW